MTIENSEDTAHESVPDPAEAQGIEAASGSSKHVHDGAALVESATSAVIEVARNLSSTHDSAPPLSRKLAPPPKPKRDSGAASSPPPGVGAESADLLASGANALKAPIPPTISYSADDTAKMPAAPALPEPPAFAAPAAGAAGASAPLSQPPPIPRRRSNPAIASEDGEGQGGARAPSDPSLTASAGSEASSEPAPRAPLDTPPKGVSAPPRPITSPPRPRSDPPPAARPRSEPPPASAAPPSSSAIFAMRIIAVGDSVRPPAVQENAPDLDPDSYPPSASRLGTSVRRSSRPAIAAASSAPVAVPAAAPLPSTVSFPEPAASVSSEPVASVSSEPVLAPEPVATELAASVPHAVAAPGTSPVVDVPLPPANLLGANEEDIPIDVEPPIVAAPAPPVAGVRPPPPPPPVDLGAVPREELRQVLGEDAPDSDEEEDLAPAAAAATDAEELGREDAISLPPEEIAALKAELDAKAEAVKPPPPPKRTTGVLSVAPNVATAVAPPVSSPTSAEAPPKEPPPTPDPAAAKAAQRAKTRQPWWEDLFNEDFMRASSRVSDEQIRKEVTFIEESLGVAAGGVVLDLGCGAGHHAVEFASRGYGVVGYDLSLYQLALAADVAQERSQKINFLQGDMREMAFEEMFDGVFCWNTTFGYFEEDKNLAVAQRVFKALRPGGMFLIDVLNRDFAAASAPCSVWYEGDSCVCMDDMSVDYISSRLRVKRSIILDDGRTKESLYSLRLYSLHELGKLLHEVGFRVTEASGHPSTPGVFFGPNSPRIIMLAQRP
ncbi:MAG: methyltransferase domain-containing protein [Myxococcales bacterium]